MTRVEDESDVKINVTPLLVQDDVVVCEITPDTGYEQYVKGGVIKLNKDRRYTLEFRLQHGDPAGLLFQDTADAAFWCDMKSCPDRQMMKSGNQLQSPAVGPDQTSLTLV